MRIRLDPDCRAIGFAAEYHAVHTRAYGITAGGWGEGGREEILDLRSYETGEGKMTREEINRGIEHTRALHPNARESICSSTPLPPEESELILFFT